MNQEINDKVLAWVYTPNKNASTDTHFLFELVKLVIDNKASKSDVLTVTERIFDKETVSALNTVLSGVSDMYLTRDISGEGLIPESANHGVKQRTIPQVNLEVLANNTMFNYRWAIKQCLHAIKELTDTVKVDSLSELKDRLLSIDHIDDVTVTALKRSDDVYDVMFKGERNTALVKLTLQFTTATTSADFKGVNLMYINPKEYHEFYNDDTE